MHVLGIDIVCTGIKGAIVDTVSGDLINQKHIDLSSVEIFVLDEADRMLDMGFIHDIKRVIAKLPKKRQSLFYSATMEPKVVELARTLVHDPVHVTITPNKPTVDRIDQKVMFVAKGDKDKLIIDLLKSEKMNRVMVFVQMKHVANKVAGKLEAAGGRGVAAPGAVILLRSLRAGYGKSHLLSRLVVSRSQGHYPVLPPLV